MHSDTNNLFLLDILNQKNNLLRQQFEIEWGKKHSVSLSATEWVLLGKFQQQAFTLAQVSKDFDITRQATHKSIRSLEAKGLIETYACSQNRRVKMGRITPLGKEYYTEGKNLKQTLQNELIKTIQPEGLTHLLQLLKQINFHPSASGASG